MEEGIEGDEYKFGTNFTNIPAQGKMYIFAFLKQKSRQILRGVCCQFRQIVDAMPCAVLNNGNYERTVELTDVYIIKVENFTTELQSVVMFKSTVRRLEFWEIVVSYNLFHLLKECPRVQELTFANVMLDSYKKMKCPDGLALSEVRVLAFRTKWRTHFTVHELILFDLLRQIKFSKLEQVSLEWSIDPYEMAERDADMMIEIKFPSAEPKLPSGIKLTGLLELLLENRLTVKTFKAHQTCKLRPFGGSPMIQEIADQIDALQFEKLQCDVLFITGNETQVLERQRHLKEMKIDFLANCWPALAAAIQRNASTLTKAEIGTSGAVPTDREPKDASIFKDCVSLEQLSWSTVTPFQNLVQLPDSIRNLTLHAPFTREELLAMVSKLRNLQEVKLNHIPFYYEHETFCFNNEIVQGFLGIGTLKKLLARGINFNVDTEDIAIIAKSPDAFDISFRRSILLGQYYGQLVISKVLLTPSSEPST